MPFGAWTQMLPSTHWKILIRSIVFSGMKSTCPYNIRLSIAWPLRQVFQPNCLRMMNGHEFSKCGCCTRGLFITSTHEHVLYSQDWLAFRTLGVQGFSDYFFKGVSSPELQGCSPKEMHNSTPSVCPNVAPLLGWTVSSRCSLATYLPWPEFGPGMSLDLQSVSLN